MTERARQLRENEGRIRKVVAMMAMFLFLVLFSAAAVYADDTADAVTETTGSEIKETADVPAEYADTGTGDSLSPGDTGDQNALPASEEASAALTGDSQDQSAISEDGSTDNASSSDAVGGSDDASASDKKDGSSDASASDKNGSTGDTSSSGTDSSSTGTSVSDQTSDSSATYDATSTSTSDTTVVSVLAPKTGSAEIIEMTYTETTAETHNKVDELMDALKKSEPLAEAKVTNDVPTVSHIVCKDTSLTDPDDNEADITDDYWMVEETGQCVEIDTTLYPLPKVSQTKTSTPIGTVVITTTTYTSKNAIQKAIDEALTAYSNLSDKTKASYTITIAVDPGEYDGDISVQQLAMGDTDFWNKLTLYILARDAFTSADEDSGLAYDKKTICAAADGTVHVNGTLKINSVHTVIAGLYFSSDASLCVLNSKADVYGTEEQDTITVELYGSTSGVKLDSGDGSDLITLTEYQVKNNSLVIKHVIKDSVKEAAGTADISTGDGDDLVTIDMSAADSLCKITVNGSGYGRVHFTGELAEDGGNSSVKNTSDSAKTFTFNTSSERTLEVITNGVKNFSDALENKKQINITVNDIKDGKIVIADTADRSLYDYYLKVYGNTEFYTDSSDGKGHLIRDIIMNVTGDLVGLVIDDLARQDTVFVKMYKPLYVGNIDAVGANVRILSHDIVFTAGSNVNVNNLIAEASYSDTFKSLFELLGEDLTQLPAYLWNCDASIRTESGSVIHSQGDVSFTVTVTQTSDWYDIGTEKLQEALQAVEAGVNFLNVKLGDAEIDHEGQITANGNVWMKTVNTVKITSGNSMVADPLYIFCAINVGVIKSTVDVKANGSIDAYGTVDLKAASKTEATSGAVLGKLPLAVSIAVIVNDTHVDVQGSIVSEKASVTLEADSENTISSSASSAIAGKYVVFTDANGNETGKTAGTKRSTNGYYLSASGAKITTYAKVSGAGTVTAAKNVNITSSSLTNNATYARALDAGTVGSVAPTSETTYSGLKMVSAAISRIINHYKGTEDEANINLTREMFIAAAGNEITLEGSGNGTISSVKRAKKGETVDLIITPQDGYTIDTITISYQITNEDGTQTLKRETATRGTNSDNSQIWYMFDMPDAAVTVNAVFRAATDDDPAIINRTSAQSNISASDAMKAASETYFKTEKYGTTVSISDDNKKFDHGKVISNTDKADAGQKIRFTVTPDKGYKLSKLTVTYTLNNTQVVQTIDKAAAGYTFVLPTDLASGKIIFEAEFEEDETGSLESEVSRKGCVAAGVIFSSNTAQIDTTGTVSAGGSLSLDASTSVQSCVVADASAVEQKEETAVSKDADTSLKPDSAKKQSATTKEITLHSTGANEDFSHQLIMSAAAGGTYDLADKDENGYNVLRFNVHPDEGYTVKQVQISFNDAAANRDVSFDMRDNGAGQYQIDNEAYTELTGLAFDESNISGIIRVTVLFDGTTHNVGWADGSEQPSGAVIPETAMTGARIIFKYEGEVSDYNYTVYTEKTGNAGSEVADAGRYDENLNAWVITVPNNAIYIKAVKKPVEIQYGTNAETYVSGQNRANAGETVKLSQLSADKTCTISLTVNGEKKFDLYDAKTGSFVVPDGASAVVINIESEEDKAYTVHSAAKETEGKVTGNTRVNAGETITVTVTAASGYALDSDDPVRISFTDEKGTVHDDPMIESDKTGVYTYDLKNSTLADSDEKANITVTPKFKKDASGANSNKKNNTRSSWGVGVSVGIFTSDNIAEISKGTISADGISVSASSGTDGTHMRSEVQSSAGEFSGDHGFAGAFSVNYTNIKTTAQICNAADVTIGTDSLSVNAGCRSQVNTTAEGSDTKTEMAKTGKGVGISFHVANVVTKAEIADGLKITQIDKEDETDKDKETENAGTKGADADKQSDSKEKSEPSLQSVSVTANTIHTESVKASAGMAGGSDSWVPACSAVISGVSSDALIGSAENAQKTLRADKDVTITASTAVSRKMETNADAAAGNSAYGISVSVSYINDTAESKLKRNVKAGDVNVKASARTYVKSTAKASSKGGKEQKSTSNTGSDAGGNGGDADPAQGDNDGAAAENNENNADDQADQEMGGALNLAAHMGEGNGNGANAGNAYANRQKAQSTEGDVTAAAVINVNIQETKATAKIVDGLKIDASGSVSVISAARSDTTVTSTASAVGTYKAATDSSTAKGTNSEWGVGAAIAINAVHITNEAFIGNTDITAGNLYVQALTPTSAKESEASVLNQTVPDNILTQWVKSALTKALDDAMKINFPNYDSTKVPSSESERIVALIEKEFIGFLSSEATIISETMLEGTGLKGLITADIWTKVQKLVSDYVDGNLDPDKKAELQEHAENLVINTVLSAMANYFQDDNGKALEPKYIQDNYSVPGTLKRQLITLANDIFGQFIDINQFVTFLKGNWGETLKKNFAAVLKKSTINLSTHVINAILEGFEVKSENETAGNRSVITTTAISGAGSCNITVAGSLAWGSVNNEVRAEVIGLENTNGAANLKISGNLIIIADDRIKTATTATSSTREDGSADTNNGAGSTTDISGDGDGKYDASEVSGSDGKLNIAATEHGQILQFFTIDDGTLTAYVKPDEGYQLKDGQVTIEIITKNDQNEDVTETIHPTTVSYDSNNDRLIVTTDRTLDARVVKATISAVFEEQLINIELNTALHGTFKVLDNSGSELSVVEKDGKKMIENVKTGQTIKIQLTPEEGYTFDEDHSSYIGYNPLDSDAKKFSFTKQGGNSLTLSLWSYANVNLENGYSRDHLPALKLTVSFCQTDAAHKALGDDDDLTPSGSKIGFGASFALTKVKNTCVAALGGNSVVSCGDLMIKANSIHNESATAVAGLDPLSKAAATDKTRQNSSVDASIALTFADSDTVSGTGNNCKITGTGTGSIILSQKVIRDEKNPEVEKKEIVDSTNYYIASTESGTASSKASSFSVGVKDAVGASAALVADTSNVKTTFEGSLTVDASKQNDSDIRILSSSERKDVVRGTATAMGADFARYFNKVGNASAKASAFLNDAATGNYDFESLLKSKKNSSNKTAASVNDKLNDNKDDSGEDTDASLPTSTNILKAAGAKSEDVNAEQNGQVDQALEQANNEGGVQNQAQKEEGKKVQFAAVVAWNILNHTVTANVSGTILGGTINIGSDLYSDFDTIATAAAMSRANKSNSIAGAVAITSDHNKAYTTVSGTVKAAKVHTEDEMFEDDKTTPKLTNDLQIHAKVLENIGKGFNNKVTAQAISGAVTGKDADRTISIALAIVRSNSEAIVTIENGSQILASDTGTVAIISYNISKLTAVAGGVSVSKGTALGTGVSFALIYENSKVNTNIGTNMSGKDEDPSWLADRIIISGCRVRISSVRDEVDKTDRLSGNDFLKVLKNFVVTKSSAGGSAGGGLVDFQYDSVKKTYTASLNVSTDKLIDSVNLLNYLIWRNYYVQAVGGDIVTGASNGNDTTVTGSAAMLFYRADTGVSIGDGCTISQLKGDASVTASDKTTSLVIAGGINVSPAKNGNGLSFTCFTDNSDTYVHTGRNAAFSMAGSYTQNAESSTDVVIVSVAANETTESGGEKSRGGSFNAAVLENKVESTVGDGTKIYANNGDIQIKADDATELIMVAAATPGTSGKVAEGGTLSVIISGTEVEASVGSNVEFMTRNSGSIRINAVSEQKLVNALGAFSPAFQSKGNENKSLAATIGITIAGEKVTAKAGDSVRLMSQGDIEITASANDSLITADAAVNFAKKSTYGGSVLLTIFNKTVCALIGSNATLTASNGTVVISASVKDFELLAALVAGASSGEGNVLEGAVPICIDNNTAEAVVGSNTWIEARSIGVMSVIDTEMYTAAGALSVQASGDSQGFGTVISTSVDNSKATAKVNSGAQLTAYFAGSTSGVKIPNREERRRGITVYAGGKVNMVSAALAVSGGKGKGTAAAVVNTVAMNSEYNALTASDAVLRETSNTSQGDSGENETGSDDEDPAQPGISVETHQDLTIVEVTDATAVAKGTAGGGALSVLVLNSTLNSTSEATVYAGGNYRVIADSKGTVTDLTLTAEGSKDLAAAAVIQVLAAKDTVTAALKGIAAQAKNVLVSSTDDLTIQNVVIEIAGSGANAYSGALAFTYFSGTTASHIGAGTIVRATGNVRVYAYSTQYLNSDVTGAMGSMKDAAEGGLNIIISKVSTKAWIGEGATVIAGSDVTVLAENSFSLIGVAAYVTGSGDIAVGIAAVVMIDVNTVYAAVEDNCNITAGGDVIVKAITSRDIIGVSATVSGSGNIAGGIALTMITSGNRMSQDAWDELQKGNFNTGNAVISCLSIGKHSGYDDQQKSDLQSEIELLLSGDGQRYSETKKDGTESGYGPDVSSYVSYSDNMDSNGNNTAVMPGGVDSSMLERLAKQEDSSSSEDPDGDKDVLTGLPEEESKPASVKLVHKDFTDSEISTNYDSTVTARIGKNTVVKASNISIIALEETTLTEVSGQVSISGKGALGIGFSAAMFNTNVYAYAAEGAKLYADTSRGTITICAGTGCPSASSGDSKVSLDKIDNSNIDAKKTIDYVNTCGYEYAEGCGKVSVNRSENRFILIGLTGDVSGGAAGGVSGAVFELYDQVRAISAANLTAYNAVVRTDVNYKEVLAVSAGAAVSLGSAGGSGAVGFSVGMVYYSATVETGVAYDADLDIRGKLLVHSEGTVNAQTAAATLAASGNLSIAANAAITVNNIVVRTYLGRSVTGTVNDLEISNTWKKSSKTFGIAISVGLEGTAGIAAVIAVDNLDAAAVLGWDSQYSTEGMKGVSDELLRVSSTAEVLSDISGDMFLLGVPVSIGTGGASILVVVGRNVCSGTAEVTGKKLLIGYGDSETSGGLTICAELKGDISIYTASAAAVEYGGGVTVAVGDQKSTNQAILDLTGEDVIVTGKLTVSAGKSLDAPSTSDVTVMMLAIGAEGFGAELNFAISRNTAENDAKIIGTGKGSLNVGGNASVAAYGNAYAYTFGVSINAHVGGATPVLSYAEVKSTQNACIETDLDVRVGGDLTVESYQNIKAPGKEVSLNQYEVNDKGEYAIKTDSKALVIHKTNMVEAYAGNAALSGGNAVVSIAVAHANAESNAYVKVNNLNVNGSVQISNTANSTSSAKLENFDSSIGTAGTTISHAYADGTFRAFMNVKGSVTVNGNKGICITNIYASECVSELTPSALVNLHGGEIMVNFAFARAATDAEAYIDSSETGSVTAANGPIAVLVDGTRIAQSRILSVYIRIEGVNLTANISKARISKDQKAYLKGGTIQAQSLTVESYVNSKNNGDAKADNTDAGAFASLDTEPVGVELGNVTVNYIDALFNVNGETYVTVKKLNIEHDAIIRTFAFSNAQAKNKVPGLELKPAVNIPINIILSDASGTFKTYLDVQGNAGNETVSVGGRILISTIGNTQSKTTMAAAGGNERGQVQALNVTVNEAKSDTTAKFYSTLKGTGKLSAGSVTVTSTGRTNCDASMDNTISIAIGIVSAQSLEVTSTIHVVRNANLELTGSGTIGGDLIVTASGDSHAEASGAFGSAFNLTLLDGKGLNAQARSYATTLAVIKGSGECIHVGGNLEVNANNTSYVKTYVGDRTSMELSLLKLEVYLSKAVAQDITRVSIMHANLEVDGKITIHSSNDITVQADSVAGNSITILNGYGGTVQTFIGETNPEEASIVIGERSVLRTTGEGGSIWIVAVNHSDNTSVLNPYSCGELGVFTASENNVPTSTKLKTTIIIRDDSEICSEKDSVTVKALDFANAYSSVNGNSIGILFDGVHKNAYNEVIEDVSVNIESGSTVSAYSDVVINADSTADLTASTEALAGGILSSGYYTAENVLKHTVEINIKDESKIISDHGNISIRTQAGAGDKVSSTMKCGQGALVATATVVADVKYQASSVINIGESVKISALSGYVLIRADVNMSNIYLESYHDLDGGIILPDARAIVNDFDKEVDLLKAEVNIIGEAGKEAEIIGKNITITSILKDFEISINSRGTVAGVGGSVYSTSTLYWGLDLKTKIKNAVIRAENNLNIYSDGENYSFDSYIDIHSQADLSGAGGATYSNAELKKSFDRDPSVETLIEDGVILEGMNILIDAHNFYAFPKIKADSDFAWYEIGPKHTNEVNQLKENEDRTASVNISDGTEFILKGIQENTVTIYKEGDKVKISFGKESYDAVLKDNEVILEDFLQYFTKALLEIHRNQNENGLLNCTIRVASGSDSLTFVNKTDYNLKFGTLDMDDLTNGAEVKFVDCVSQMLPEFQTYEERTITKLSVFSEYSTDVLFNGLVSVPRGEVEVAWADSLATGGNLYTAEGGLTLQDADAKTAVVWANKLTVKNANNVGYAGNADKDKYFWAYLTVVRDSSSDASAEETQKAFLNIQAAHNIWFRTSPASVVYSRNSDSVGGDTDAANIEVEMQSLSAGDDCDILVEDGILINKSGSRYIHLVPVGTAVFSEKEFSADEKNNYITRSWMDYYRQDSLSTDTEDAYELPNGVILYVSKDQGDGTYQRVTRIEAHDGQIADLGKIVCRSTSNDESGIIYMSDYGITLNSAGFYTAAADSEGIYQILNWEFTDNTYKPTNLTGTIIAKNSALIYDRDYNEVTLKNRAETEDKRYYYYWLTDDQEKSDGYIIVYSAADDTFAGVYAAGVVDQVLTIGRQVNISYYQNLAYSDYCAYFYTDSNKTPNWYVIPYTAYYYQDSSTPDVLHHIYQMGTGDLLVSEITIAGQKVQIPTYTFGKESKGTAYIFVSVSDSLKGKGDVSSAQITFNSNSESGLNWYMINAELQFSSRGDVQVDTRYTWDGEAKDTGYVMCYNPLLFNETIPEHGAISFHDYSMDQEGKPVMISGVDNLNVELFRNKSYGYSEDGTKDSAHTIATIEGSQKLRILIRTPEYSIGANASQTQYYILVHSDQDSEENWQEINMEGKDSGANYYLGADESHVLFNESGFPQFVNGMNVKRLQIRYIKDSIGDTRMLGLQVDPDTNRLVIAEPYTESDEFKVLVLMDPDRKTVWYRCRTSIISADEMIALTPAEADHADEKIEMIVSKSGHVTIDQLIAENAVVRSPYRSGLYVRDAVCSESLKLMAAVKNGNKLVTYEDWTNVRIKSATDMENSADVSDTVTFEFTDTKPEDVPESADGEYDDFSRFIVFRSSGDDSRVIRIEGGVSYEPGKQEKLLIYAAKLSYTDESGVHTQESKYLGTNNQYAGFEIPKNDMLTEVVVKSRDYVLNGGPGSGTTDGPGSMEITIPDESTDGGTGSTGSDGNPDESADGSTESGSDGSENGSSDPAAGADASAAETGTDSVDGGISDSANGGTSDSEVDDVPITQQLEEFMVRYGIRHLTVKSVKAAVRGMSDEEREKYAELMLKMACAELCIGHTDQAEEYIRMASALDSDHDEILLLKGMLQLKKGKTAKAKNYFRKYLKSEKGKTKDRKYMLLISLLQETDEEKLADTYRTAMEQEKLIFDEESVRALRHEIDRLRKEVMEQYEEETSAA